jgi:hypothetical protein
MANNKGYAAENTDIFQHLSEAHLQHQMARENPKRRSVGACRTGIRLWQRNTEAELKQHRSNGMEVTEVAQNRVRWRGVVDGLCSSGGDGPK